MAMEKLRMGGAPEGYDALILARELARGHGLLHIARDDKRMAALRAGLTLAAPDVPVLEFPAWDCLPYDRASPHPDILARRLATLDQLLNPPEGPFVLLTTLSAASQRLPRRAVLQGARFSARVGTRVDEAALLAYLSRMGFRPVGAVAEPGDYARRGGLIDIYPPGAEGPLRLDFFGDLLESVRRFEVESQRSNGRLDALHLTAASEVMLDELSIARFRQNYRAEFGAMTSDDPLYEAVSAGRKHQGMEHWLPFFHEGLETLFDYLPGASVVLDDQIPAAQAQRWQTVSEQYEARCEAMAARGRMETLYRPLPPQPLYLSPEAWEAALAPHRLIALSPLPQAPGPGILDAGGRQGRSFAAERQAEKVSIFKALADHLRALSEEKPVFVACWSEGARERLRGLLADEGLAGLAAVAALPKLGAPAPKGQVGLVVWPLEEGFVAPELAVISEQDVLGERLTAAPRRRRKADNFLREADGLSPGDLVVHIEHGLGRYQGLETIRALGAPHDCLALEYAEGAKLYLPVENIELLSRYGQEEGTLDKLGGGAWQARKAKAKERIREMADRLLRVAAERMLRAAPALESPGQAWENFAARFPYVETDDQLSAIADVLGDFEKPTPMDRLIVGDVGFGKTEVAMRAAFLAAASGLQVALVCPTTLLARQHFRSFQDRFRGFPFRIATLSRFVPARQAEETRAALARGEVDICIGTHALLAKSVEIKNLGLLIIDEEQHFGVAHKERLKEMRAEVHVLTLTATPIPRTLQLSLSGVRDLSIIATPPVDRLAVRTYVSEFDGLTLREALLRERYRGGQSFFVVPRIADLPEIEEFLKEKVPEVRYVIAHGQMAAGELDARMNDFYDGKYDVLLSTTIIESGLDIPTANTMIVYRADMFGLSQLYQIRGRVGRAKIRAYCYLMTKPRQPLTPGAEKRLRLLSSLDTLGAGFTLASHDLDQRGAGNLLGDAQSGHIREVGYELYQQMLEETIAQLKAGQGALPPVDEPWAPQLALGVPVLIPEAYVPDLDLRLGLYRRLAQLSGKTALEGFAAELIDRFGPLPSEVNTLLLVLRIKAMCKRAGIAKLDAGPKGANVQFHEDRFGNPAGLAALMQEEAGALRISGKKLVFARNWPGEGDRIKGAFAIARDLAQRAAGPA